MAKKSGVTLKEPMGRYDVVAVFEAADDESAEALRSASPLSAM
jgi:uncharacterized protein with GYD domain